MSARREYSLFVVSLIFPTFPIDIIDYFDDYVKLKLARICYLRLFTGRRRFLNSFPIGEIAALVVSVLWTACSVLFAAAGRRIGALSVNAYRIAMAVGLLGAAHFIRFGTFAPPADGTQWFYLGLSGVIGLALGDFGYFGALVMIGPRRGVLLMAMAPIWSSIAAYIVLGEVLGAWTIAGIGVTLAGVTLVVLEREDITAENSIPARQKLYGILSGLGGSLGQGIGLVVSKYGMLVAGGAGAPPLNPLSATLVRMVIAAAFIWTVVVVTGRLPRIIHARRDAGAVLRTLGGAVSGPFAGVWLSMVAITYAKAGVAATLMALMPVMVIPVVRVVYGERTSIRGIIGACTAVVGVAILFLV
jgi:drug/metabolite transporter (DMT)-like permease